MRLLALIILMLSFGGPMTLAGNTDGAGGATLSCKDGNKLYDLWEATLPGVLSEKGLKIVYSDQDVMEQVRGALTRYFVATENLSGETLVQAVESRIDRFISLREDLPAGTKITAPKDLDSVFTNEKCDAILGLARWMDEKNRLYIDKTLYNALATKTDQAALIVHELIYSEMRGIDPSLETSFAARLVTAYLFSDIAVEALPFHFKNGLYSATNADDQQNQSPEIAVNPLDSLFVFSVSYRPLEGNDSACAPAVAQVSFARGYKKNKEKIKIKIVDGQMQMTEFADNEMIRISASDLPRSMQISVLPIKPTSRHCVYAVAIKDGAGRIMARAQSGNFGSKKFKSATIRLNVLTVTDAALLLSHR